MAIAATVQEFLRRGIVFNGGSHTDAICMRYGDFARLAQPIVGSFAVRPFAVV